MHGLAYLCHEAGNGGNNGRRCPTHARTVFLSRPLDKAVDTLRCKKFFCLPDAQAAAKDFKQGDFHQVSFVFEEHPVYGRGQPSKKKERTAKK